MRRELEDFEHLRKLLEGDGDEVLEVIHDWTMEDFRRAQELLDEEEKRCRTIN